MENLNPGNRLENTNLSDDVLEANFLNIGCNSLFSLVKHDQGEQRSMLFEKVATFSPKQKYVCLFQGGSMTIS